MASGALADVAPAKPAAPAAPAKPAAPAPAAAAAPADPVAKRAAALREAAALLERASKALASGNRNLADQLFSQAELLAGPESLADLAGPFRVGGPPRVTTPTIAVDKNAAPQPAVLGSSEQEDEEDKVAPPKVEASLVGSLQLGGRAASGVGLVTLEPIGGKKVRKRPLRHRVIEQRGREFSPRLTAVSVGSTISFPNFDTVFHNVFSTSPSGPFDLGLYRAGEAREVTFTKEGVLRVACNLHANMSAYVAVVAAPHYTVTDSTGGFSFRHLAPGKYKLSAWNERSKEPFVKEITLKVGKNQLDLSLSDDAPKGPPPDKFGGKRG